MEPDRALENVALRISSGELSGEAAFDAVVAVIASAELPPGSGPELVARVRDEVVLGVRHDRALCARIYASPESRFETGVPPQAPDARPRAPAPRRAVEADRTPRPRSNTRRPSSRRHAHEGSVLDDEARALAATQRRGRALGVAALVGGALGLWVTYELLDSPCADLATDICRNLEGACDTSEVRRRIDAAGLDDEACATKLASITSAAEAAGSNRQAAYREAVVDALGFDPRATEAVEDRETVAAPDPLPIVAGQTTMSSMFVDRAHVYWTVTDPPAIYRIRSIGGEPELLGQTISPTQLWVSEHFAYWLAVDPATPKMWADKIRGDHEPAPLELVDGHAPGLVAFLGEEAAFVDAHTGAVQIVAVAHDTPRELAPPTSPAPIAICGDGTHVYWVTGTSPRSLSAVARTGGQRSELATGITGGDRLWLDTTHVYWPAAGTVFRVSKTGGAIEEVSREATEITDLALDESQLYVADAAAGVVLAMGKDGAERRTIAQGLASPRFVAVDGAAVYWEAGGIVYRLPK